MRRLFAVTLLLFLVLPAAADDVETIHNSPGPGHVPPDPDAPIFEASSRTLAWDNGPIVNQPPNSVLQDVTLGMSVYGYGMQIDAGNHCADDFIIRHHETWTIEEIAIPGYQTGSSTTSTITVVHIQIWDGDPSLPGANVVFGDLTTNVLTSSVWSGAYRMLESAPGATNRPIMFNTCLTPVYLAEGHYWIDFQADGSLESGPWMPPVAIWNVAWTGDGLQYVSTGWQFLVDTGSGAAQGCPFIVFTESGHTPLRESTWGAVKNLFR